MALPAAPTAFGAAVTRSKPTRRDTLPGDQVLARIQVDFVNVQASLDSAQLKLFGGIEVRELRLSRKDDLDKSDFLYVPFAIIYHDKEQVLEEGLRVRKVEVHQPQIRVVRE